MSFIKEFWKWSEDFENKLAFVDEAEQITFKEFKERVLKCVGGLEKLNLQRNDAILLAVPVSISFYVHLVAAWYLGMQVLVLSDFKDKSSVAKIAKTLNVKFVFTITKLSLLRFFVLPFSLWSKTKVVQFQNRTKLQPAALEESHTALITTTSGSTGAPKIAHRSIGFLKIQFETIQEILNLQTGDTHLSSFPIVLLCNLLVGATSIILPTKKHESFIKKIRGNTHPSIISASPFYIESLEGLLRFEKVKSIVVGGSSLYGPLSKLLWPYRHQTKLIYGSTEVEPIAQASLSEFYDADKNEKGVYVGRVHDHLRLEILEPVNGIGEIAVRGAHVLPKENLRNGEMLYLNVNGLAYYRTGDLGYVAHGDLFFYGRKKFSWLFENELYSPVLCEKWNATEGIFREATMLLVHGLHIVFYCGVKEEEDRFKKLAPFHIDHFRQLQKMPKDKRHRSRILYNRLLENGIVE